MSESRDRARAQFRADRPQEQEAVRTTIVGGRPPGSGQGLGPIPRGIEVLVKKAAVDPQFKQLLFDKRDEAAGAIGLTLDPAEVMMLRAAPLEQLEAIVAGTEVPDQQRRAFLGTAAAVMLAAIGVSTPGCIPGPVTGSQPDEPTPSCEGIRPDRPERFDKPEGGHAPDLPDAEPLERPTRIEPVDGVRPEKDDEDNPPDNS